MAVKSIILGHSGVGKTTLIFSILKSLSSDDILNTIEGTYKSDVGIVDLKKQLKFIEERMRAGTNFGTTNTSQYLFRLFYLNNLISDFHFIDYRGGLLNYQDGKLNSKDKDELDSIRMIMGSANVIILMIDLTDNHLREKLISNFNEILLSLRKNPRSLLLYLVTSKSDLFGSVISIENYIRNILYKDSEVYSLFAMIAKFPQTRLFFIPIINKTNITKPYNVDTLIHHMFSYKVDYLLKEEKGLVKQLVLKNFKSRLKKAYFKPNNSFIMEVKL